MIADEAEKNVLAEAGKTLLRKVKPCHPTLPLSNHLAVAPSSHLPCSPARRGPPTPCMAINQSLSNELDALDELGLSLGLPEVPSGEITPRRTAQAAMAT